MSRRFAVLILKNVYDLIPIRISGPQSKVTHILFEGGFTHVAVKYEPSRSGLNLTRVIIKRSYSTGNRFTPVSPLINSSSTAQGQPRKLS